MVIKALKLLVLNVIFTGITSLPVISMAETRTFTNKSGSEFTGEVKGISGGKVSVERGGKSFQIPVSNLTDDDIAFLKGWLLRNPNYAVRISVFPQKGRPKLVGATRTGDLRSGYTSAPLGSRSGGQTTSVEEEHFVIMLTNDSSVPLENLSVDFRVYIAEKSNSAFGGARKEMKTEKGRISVDDLGIKQTCKVTTRSITLKNKASASTETISTTHSDGTVSVSTKTRRNRSRPEIQGIWLRVKVGDKVINDYQKFSDSLKKEEPVW